MSEYLWKKEEAAAEAFDRPEIVKRVLVLYTGGTIGMKWTKEMGYKPAYSYLEEKIKTFPTLCDDQYQVNMNSQWIDLDPLVPIPLPSTLQGYRILYSIIEYSPLLDSSNLSMEDWATIARDLNTHYKLFNGFVILHGTDTMAYTASALSFMCENLGKTIILTGSQVPISELRNDARDNILGSLILAGQYIIPEVCIFFNNKLYRGNRATKTNSAKFDAFTSPNLAPLAIMAGVDISIEWDAIHRSVETKRFTVKPDMNRNVGILRLFPGITQATIKSFLQPPMQGVVLQTYGAGNAPDNRAHSYLFKELKAASARGVVVVNCTQCYSGVVTDTYAGGIKLREVGVVSGMDMTAEAALTKLSYLLATVDSPDHIRNIMTQNIRGELTKLDSNQLHFSLKDSELLRAVAETLCISSSKEVRKLRQTLFPPLMCAAASNGDISALESLRQQGGDFNIPDYDGRTALHLASCEGHLETVRYLLQHGASVHATDRFNCTPLQNAKKFNKVSVVNLLVKTGADTHEQQQVCDSENISGRALEDHDGWQEHRTTTRLRKSLDMGSMGWEERASVCMEDTVKSTALSQEEQASLCQSPGTTPPVCHENEPT